MYDNPFFALSFLSAPAILMNACAVLQNGTNVRYNLAVTQLRDFRLSILANDGRLHSLYSDTAAVLFLARKRVKILLRGLTLIYLAVGSFGLTTFIGLIGTFLPVAYLRIITIIKYSMISVGGLGMAFLLAAVLTFMRESALANAMLRLHLRSFDLSPGPSNSKIK